MTKDEALRLALEALEKLWNIIDDIDTYSDMAKADEKLYRTLVERRQRQRFEETGISTDGYELHGGAITAIKAALEAKDEAVAWPCLIANADFDKETVTLVMQCSDYKVSAGMHWLLTTPPQRTWVGLTPEDTFEIGERLGLSDIAWVDLMQAIEAKLKQKNT
jgi:hypothetical protein